MTLPTTWSSGSTNRRYFFAALALIVVALTGSGCATNTRPASPPPIRGYVNLDALTRRHPGWSGVSRYDAALRRLEQAARSLPPADRPDQKIALLPALPAVVAGGGAALPIADAGQVGRHLMFVQQTLMAELRSRREMARDDQIASREDVWQRDARQQYPIPAQEEAIQPDLALQLLQANVETLTQTLDGWKQSVPPAPRWEALRAEVEADRARLQALIAARVQARDAAQVREAADVQHLQEARVAYVQTQENSLAAQLRAEDENFIADQQARLTRQRTDLLTALAQAVPVSVPNVGDAGPQTLPQGPGVARAALSSASLSEAETRLSAQRARWIRHLYDDTQAAARDTADQRNWDVTFGPPRPGDRDLTQALAQAMSAGVWRL